MSGKLKKIAGGKRKVFAAAILALQAKGKLWGQDAKGRRRKGIRSAGKRKTTPAIK